MGTLAQKMGSKMESELENKVYSKMGSVEIIVGGMYSGKTEELIRRIRRAIFARQPVQVFKPQIDNRYHADHVTTHNLDSVESKAVENANQILELLLPATQVVAIDEGQFFDSAIVEVVETLASLGKRVIVAGLDTDWKAKPFHPMPTLMAIAESVTKQHAVCVVCGEEANRTQRVQQHSDQVVVGSHGVYEARCRTHFVPDVATPYFKGAANLKSPEAKTLDN